MEEENKNFLKKLYSLKDVPIKLSGVQKFALFVFVTNLIVLLDVRLGILFSDFCRRIVQHFDFGFVF